MIKGVKQRCRNSYPFFLTHAEETRGPLKIFNKPEENMHSSLQL